MNKELWKPDQPVFSDDLERAQSSKEDAIKNRLLDIFSKGTLDDSQLLGESVALSIVDSGSGKITVNSGVGISPAGERIIISSVTAFNASNSLTTTDNGIGGTTLTPQSTGSSGIQLVNGTNYIWLGYLQTIDTTVYTLQKFTKERLFVKADDGFEIQTNLTGTNPDSNRFILIGKVVVSGGLVTTISITNTVTSQSTSTSIPATPGPYTVALSPIPVSIPIITGFTYATTVAPNTFTANFDTGVLTFDASNQSQSITVTYESEVLNREFARTHSNRAAAYVEVVDKPSVYTAGRQATLHEHMNAKGSGTVSPANPHALSAADLGILSEAELGSKLASSGIITTDLLSQSSALFPAITLSDTADANVIIFKALGDGEAVNVDGTIVSNSILPDDVEFRFVDSLGLPITAGVYTFYLMKATSQIQRIMEPPVTTDLTKFPLLTITWTVASPTNASITAVKDLRVFGTVGNKNVRNELLNALALGGAISDRSSAYYYGSINGTVASTGLVSSYTGLLGLVLRLKIDGSFQSYTFTSNTLPIDIVVYLLNINFTGLRAIRTLANTIKLLAPVSLEIDTNPPSTANPIFGFNDGDTSDSILKEILVSGDFASTSKPYSATAIEEVEVILTYDLFDKVIQVDTITGNKTLTSVITYNVDDSIATITESVL